MRTEILGELKLRLGLTHKEYDLRFLSYIDEVLGRIQSYCNLDRVPAALFHTAVSMSVDLIRMELSYLPEIGESILVGGGTKLRMGDAEVSYGTGARGGAGIGNTGKSVLDSLCLNYAHDLHRVRRPGVTG